jgi:hypothetical protein
MQEGLWLHNMYLMNTNLWTFGATTSYNESSSQNQQWTKKRTIIAKKLLYLTTCHKSLLQGRCFQNICKSFKLVGTYQSNSLNKVGKKKTPNSLMKLLAKQEWAWIASNHSKPFNFFLFVSQLWSKLLVARIKNTHETKKTYSKGIQEHTKLWNIISKFEIKGSRVKIHREKYLSHTYCMT